MAHVAWMSILRHIRRLGVTGVSADVSDTDLMYRFIVDRDENAFAALIGRHGPMVWGVCRRLLPLAADAEDAFQATFLVLVRKASSLRQPDSVGPWLHGVAHRVAIRLRKDAARRRAKERPLVDPPAARVPSDTDRNELRLLLDEEVNRLPAHYRVAFVLCQLEGLTNDEAARLLGCPGGTVLSRLSRAREQLRQRLTRRGVSLSGAALSVAILETARAAPVPAELAAATAHLGPVFSAGVACVDPTNASILAEGVMTTMSLTKLQLTAVVLVAFGLFGAGSGIFVRRGEARLDPPAATADPMKVTVAAPAPQPKTIDQPAVPPAMFSDRELRDALTRTTTYDGIDDPKATLQDALDQLRAKYNIEIIVNEQSYATNKPSGILQLEIAAPMPLPPMKAPLDTILRKILARLPGECESTYFIRDGHVEILSSAAARRELGLAPNASVPRLVYQVFEDTSLLNALRTISETSEVNVVVDPRAAETVKELKIRASLRNVLPTTAVRTLAAMGDLHVARLGNVLFVTDDVLKIANLEQTWHAVSPEPAPTVEQRVPEKKK
jgi:RNA polymerase sigma factor (sigma-70 family)